MTSLIPSCVFIKRISELILSWTNMTRSAPVDLHIPNVQEDELWQSFSQIFSPPAAFSPDEGKRYNRRLFDTRCDLLSWNSQLAAADVLWVDRTSLTPAFIVRLQADSSGSELIMIDC